MESPLACYMIPQSLQNDLLKPEQDFRKSPRNAINCFEDDLIIEDDDFEMECEEQLRVEEVADPALNSTLSDIDAYEGYPSPSQEPLRLPMATEHDRFIPTRQAYGEYACGFETKELLFNQKLFTCSHSAHEQCDCLR